MSTEQNILSAIAIASDPGQDRNLQNEAVEFLNTVRAGATETWPIALKLFVGDDSASRTKQNVQVRLFALQVLDELLDNRQEELVNAGAAQETYATLQSTLGGYITEEYVTGSAEAHAPFIRNKFSHTLALLFLCTYPDQWPTFFTSISPLLHASPGSSSTTLNPHVTTFFLRLLLEISGEIHDQTIKSARTFVASRHTRDTNIRDAIRAKDAVGVNAEVTRVLEETIAMLEGVRAGGAPVSETIGQAQLIELIELAIRAFASYVPWIDINLTVTPATINMLFKLLSDSAVSVRIATSGALLRIVQKGLKEPADKLQLFRVLSLGQVLEVLEQNTRITGSRDETDDEEISYRESLGKLTSGLGLELIKLCDEQSAPPPAVLTGAEELLQQLLPVMLRFLADEYDDISSSVFPMLSQIFVVYKRAKKNTPQTHLTPSKRTFLMQTLEILLQKMRWNPEDDPEELDDEDRVAFETLRSDLRLFLDSISAIDEELVTSAIKTLAMNTLSRVDESTGWADAELSVYLVYLYGEFQKGDRSKGRVAFATPPEEITKDRRKSANWEAYPLTPHGEMLDALMQSRISAYPNNTVAIQYFETVGRYGDFFKVRKQYVGGVLTTLIDARGIHHPKESVRRRVFYIFYKFIKECKLEIPLEHVTTIIDNMRDVLVVRAELPEPESSEQDLLSEALGSAGLFDSQLYLFESVGTLVSLLDKEPEKQAAVLESVTNPLLASLQQSIQTPVNGPQDILPILQAHHVIRALGSVAKGFPEATQTAQESIPAWILVLKQVAEAVLVSLENMNQHRAIRDASRFAFARIIASTGSNITQYIPVLMNRLIRQSQPVELVDFLSFLSFTVHKLQNEIFNVLDELISPLSTHIFELLARPVEGTDDRLQHNDTKKAYLDFVTHIMNDRMHAVFVSERNKEQLPTLVQNIASIAEDISDPGSSRVALAFLAKSTIAFAQDPSAPGASAPSVKTDTVPGYQTFIYERLVPLAFGIPASPSFNIKDGQSLSATMEIGVLLKQIYQARGQEATRYLAEVYLPSKNWPPNLAAEFVTKLSELDSKQFRKYFADFVRNSGAS
ncbi:Exportin-T OS=Laccaria bicolor (strain S238N-H82 / ATCC MYA-4686) GN=LOS1 PE=3 SV=1 [Rhizoctonia solani AG-1 IB]|uniref:Exportin-T n=1 Tax=Thanatephorus cucumeris (strain AG1-IB / isolate 7/3/14) TaxID=1108050 RepID=A0A0B7FH19_THACB|nr:Exportin-T OS=Laccaria bicolor (strain S238N-H82 / ATCC MYA-4686) GN=LOS1 PE=3 SV=1 [Rhizoctonia solani AG-1 IB]